MNELALFAGAGGSILAGKLLGWRTICAVENDAGARQILLDRQRDGVLGRFPIWDDVETFDARPWRGSVQVVTGGFPCQDLSQAKSFGKRRGLDGRRSGLWSEMSRIIGEVEPDCVLIENVPALLTNGFERVLSDLAKMRFDVAWQCFRADNSGCCHKRERLYALAVNPDSELLASLDYEEPIQLVPPERKGRQFARAVNAALPADDYAKMSRDPDVLARGMDGLKATGNGWVPVVAARAFKILLGRLTNAE